MEEKSNDDVIAGAYWRARPATVNAGGIVYMGAVAPEAETAYATLAGSGDAPGLLAVTSPDRLYEDWRTRGQTVPYPAGWGRATRTEAQRSVVGPSSLVMHLDHSERSTRRYKELPD